VGTARAVVEHDGSGREPSDYERIGRAVMALAGASEAHDGHFTILGFTTHFKAFLGTPWIEAGEGLDEIFVSPGFDSVDAACEWAAQNSALQR